MFLQYVTCISTVNSCTLLSSCHNVWSTNYAGSNNSSLFFRVSKLLKCTIFGWLTVCFRKFAAVPFDDMAFIQKSHKSSHRLYDYLSLCLTHHRRSCLSISWNHQQEVTALLPSMMQGSCLKCRYQKQIWTVTQCKVNGLKNKLLFSSLKVNFISFEDYVVLNTWLWKRIVL